jgi:hypothetical protein
MPKTTQYGSANRDSLADSVHVGMRQPAFFAKFSKKSMS